MTEKEKAEFVSGKFLTCLTNFGIFKKGETYWLEYIGNDTYIGRSDNILNEKLHISDFELQAYFDTEKLTELDKFLGEWFYGMRTWGLLCGQTNEQFCDRHAHEAKKELVNLINTKCQDEIVPQSLKSKDANKYGCLEGDWQTECVIEILKTLGEDITHAHLCDVGDILMRYVKNNI